MLQHSRISQPGANRLPPASPYHIFASDKLRSPNYDLLLFRNTKTPLHKGSVIAIPFSFDFFLSDKINRIQNNVMLCIKAQTHYARD